MSTACAGMGAAAQQHAVRVAVVSPPSLTPSRLHVCTSHPAGTTATSALCSSPTRSSAWAQVRGKIVGFLSTPLPPCYGYAGLLTVARPAAAASPSILTHTAPHPAPVTAAAIMLTNKRSERRRAKYSLEHMVRVHLGADDTAYK